MAGEIHQNHRARMRRRFLEHGLDNFADHEVLELLLYYAVPRGDVNPLAHRLIEEFGSLAGVLEASPVDIQRVSGAGEAVAALLHLMPPVFRRYQLSKVSGACYNSSDLLGEMLIGYFADKPHETAAAVLLDNKCRLIRICEIGQGSANAVRINERKLLTVVLQHNAANVVLAHNHPRGACQPSRADILETSRLRELLRRIDVMLVDHIIVAERRWVSLQSSHSLHI